MKHLSVFYVLYGNLNGLTVFTMHSNVFVLIIKCNKDCLHSVTIPVNCLQYH